MTKSAFFIIFCFFFLGASAACNDYKCDVPSKFYSKQYLSNVWYPASMQTGTLAATIKFHYNADPNPGAPTWQLGATLGAVSVQRYNRCLGTYEGEFYLNVSGTLAPNANWTYNLLDNDGDYCLSFTSGSNVPEYVRGKLGADNLVYNTYLVTKNMNVRPFPEGYADRSEYFWSFDKSKTVNCLTTFSTTNARAVSETCIYYEKISDVDLPSSKLDSNKLPSYTSHNEWSNWVSSKF